MDTYTTIRFDDVPVARNFAAAARRRGYKALQRGNEVTVLDVRPHDAEVLIKTWALRRGGIPNYLVVDWA